jgi:hypothetical protein
VEVTGIPVGEVSREGEVEVELERTPCIVCVFGIAVKYPASWGQAVAEYVQYIAPCVAVVYDYGQVEACSQVKLGDKQLDLGLTISEFVKVIETSLTNGYDTGKLKIPLYALKPSLARVLYL